MNKKPNTSRFTTRTKQDLKTMDIIEDIDSKNDMLRKPVET